MVDAINSIEGNYVDLSDAELRALTDIYRERVAGGESLDNLLPEAFATAREAAKRVLGQRAYDVQVMGGTAMHFGNIAEMKTGEGKTLAAVLPCYLNALAGRGVHMVTINDYLAGRDANWMGPVYQFLGLSVGLISPNRSGSEHKAAYQADVTYGTNNEFGFDYLRDNMVVSLDDVVQRGHHFAIVDEVDSVLIDEARTPLLISGPVDQPLEPYLDFARLASQLRSGPDHDYIVDQARRTITLTDRGTGNVEDWLGVDNLLEALNTPSLAHLINALKAKELYAVDRDYLVLGGEVMIIDDVTGRLLAGRRYSDGMHQAIEAKEGLEVRQTNQTLAAITQQNYFRLYGKLAGMTGTAMTEEREFNHVYGVGVVPIPTHHPTIRADRVDLIYRTVEAKFGALVEDILERHQRGQPVLVGTVSVEDSERLSQLLRGCGVPHSVLNARHHAEEAEIIAQAGRPGAVTVSTNMAGRGTDIILGGNPDVLARAEVRQHGSDDDGVLAAATARWRTRCEADAELVLATGGLCVLGSERHESRRMDNQLRGRAGRQGDPGESQFYLSLRDDLMRRFRAGAVEAVFQRLNIPDDVPIESPLVSRQIRSAQAQIEEQNAERRKTVLRYDEVLDKQRKVIYSERLRVLEHEDLHAEVERMIDDVISAMVRKATASPHSRDWDLVQLRTDLRLLYPVGAQLEQLASARPGVAELVRIFKADARLAYQRREAELSDEVLRELERRVLLDVIDRKWREHLYEMEVLQDGIGLSFLSRVDPLIEYQRQAFDRFTEMLEQVKTEAVGFLFNLEVRVEPPAQADEADESLEPRAS
jgi:preprotein translocase subunit SecA